MAKKYKIGSEYKNIIDTETGMSIPLVSGNRHYAEFVEWMDDGNTPDNSITVQEFIDIKFAAIKDQFEAGAKLGYKAKSGIRYDAQLTDYILLKGAADLAAITGATELKVRDYYNKVHLVSYVQFVQDIVEIVSAYRIAMEAKWSAQEAVGNEGYSQFAQGELAIIQDIIEGNR